MKCYEVKVIENSRYDEYQGLLQKYLNDGYKLQWCCDIKELRPYRYQAVLLRDNEITKMEPK